MTIFQTDRLIVRSLQEDDRLLFYLMMSDPKVMAPIPQPIFNEKDSEAKLHELIKSAPKGEKMIWAISEKESADLIGICGFLMNSDKHPELAYRFRPAFWGKGYGTEIAAELINHGFNKLNYTTIDADACRENTKSIKILEKFMHKVADFWNPHDDCFDVRYRLTKNEYLPLKP